MYLRSRARQSQRREARATWSSKNSSGAMVQTVVTTGLTEFVDTQITGGLVSGDVVVIATTKSSSATTTKASGSVGLGISGGFSGGGGAIR